MTRFDPSARQRLRLLALGVASALAFVPAFAADTAAPSAAAKPPVKAAPKAPPKAADDKPREGSLGKGTGPVMSREELRLCMAEDDRLKKETADILEAQKSMQRNRSEIDRLGTELDAERSTVDRTSQAAVDAFNEKSRSRGKLIDDYKAAAPLFNERVDKLAAGQEKYAKDCADRRYIDSDYNDIKAGK